MVHDIGTELTQRLDVLAMRGGRYLRTVDRRAASARAVTLALWVSPLVPVGFLAARLSGPVDVMTMLFAALAVPVVALVGGYVGGMAGTRAGRGAALALFDHRLGLKDRIVAADEFAPMPARDGFRGAALHEAVPAVERALTDPLAIDRAHPAMAVVRRRWPFAAAAIVAALLAALLPYGVVSENGVGGGLGERLARMVAGRATSDERTAAERAATAASSTAAGVATDAARANDAGPNGAPGSRGAEGAAGDAGAISSTSATGAAGDAAAAADGKARSGANAAAQAGNARTSSAQAGTAAGEPIDPTGAAPADARSTDAATRPGDRSNGAPPAPAPGSAAPSTPRRPQQSSEGSQQGQQSRSRKGEEGGASQPGQGNGQGQNGQRSGSDEALKKSRGLSGLLLAVPMQDRLTGTINDGPVESITRRGTPRPAAAGAAATGARGAAGGAVGRIPHRPATAQERRMLEAYFARGGGTR